jgi:hypothetical protein
MNGIRGVISLGTSFARDDFAHFFAGVVLGWLWLKRLEGIEALP